MAKRRRHTDFDKSPAPKDPVTPMPPEAVDISMGPDPGAAADPSGSAFAKTVLSTDKSAGFGNIPNLSLDDPEPAVAEVIDVAEVGDEPLQAELLPEEAVLVEDSSDVLTAEPVDDSESAAPVEAVVLAEDEAADADVVSAALVEAEEENDADVAEEVPLPAEPTSAVLTADLIEPAEGSSAVESELLAAEVLPDSAVVPESDEVVTAEAGPRSHSSDVFATEFADADLAGSSAVIEPEPSATHEPLAADAIDSAVLVEPVADDEALAGPERLLGQPASDVFTGEFVQEDEVKSEPRLDSTPVSAVADEEPIAEAAQAEDEVMAPEPPPAEAEVDDLEEEPIAALLDEEPDAEAVEQSVLIEAELDDLEEEPNAAVAEKEPTAEAAPGDMDVIAAEPVSAVVEAESVEEEPIAAVAEEEPAAEAALADEEVIAAEPASAVVEAESVQEEPIAAVAEEEPAAEAALADEEVIAAEPASAVVEAESVEEEPNAVVAEEEPAAEAAPGDVDVIAAEPVSAVVEAESVEEEPIAAVAEEEPAAEADLADEEVIAAEPASAVVEAESAEEEPIAAVAEEEPAAEAALADEKLNADAALFGDSAATAEPAATESAASQAEPAIFGLDEALFSKDSVAAEPVAPGAPVEVGLDAALFAEDQFAGESSSAVPRAEAALMGESTASSSAVLGDESPIIGDEELASAEPASAVAAAEEVSALDEEEPVSAEPVSAIGILEDAAAEVLDDEEAIADEAPSGVARPEAGSAVMAAEAVDALGEETPIAAEPASAIQSLGSYDIFGIDEPASAVAAAEPASAIFAAEAEEADVVGEAEPADEEPSSAIKAVEDDEEIIAAEAASDVAEAEGVEWDDDSVPADARLATDATIGIDSAIVAAKEDLADDTEAMDTLDFFSDVAIPPKKDKQEEPSDAGAVIAEAVDEAEIAEAVEDVAEEIAEAVVAEEIAEAEPAEEIAEAEEDVVAEAEVAEEVAEAEEDVVAEAEVAEEVAEVEEDVVAEAEVAEEVAEAEEDVAAEAEVAEEVAEAEEDVVAEAEVAEEVAEAEEDVAAEAEVAEEVAEGAEGIVAEAEVAEAEEDIVAEAEVEEEVVEGENIVAEAEIAEEVAEAEEDIVAEAEIAEEATEAEEDIVAEAEVEEEVVEGEEDIVAEAEIVEEVAEAEVVEEAAEAEEDIIAEAEVEEALAEAEEDLALEIAAAVDDDFAPAGKQGQPTMKAEPTKPGKPAKKAGPAAEDWPAPKTRSQPADWPAPKTRGKPAAAKKVERIVGDEAVINVADDDGDIVITEALHSGRHGLITEAIDDAGIITEALEDEGMVVTQSLDDEDMLITEELYDDGDIVVSEAIDDEPVYGEDDIVVSEAVDDDLDDYTAPSGRHEASKYSDDGGVIERPVKPKYGRRWLGGLFLGWLLLAGSAVGVWYFAPDLVDLAVKQIPESPNAEPKEPEPQKLSPEFAIVKKKHDELRDMLNKDKSVDSKLEPKAALLALLKEREEREEQRKALEEKLTRAVEGGDKAREALARVNKILPNKGDLDKELQKLLGAYKDLDGKLTEVNKSLEIARIKGEGPAGVKELIDVRDKLEADRDNLDLVVKDALKELVDARALKAGAESRKEVLEGIKAIRAKSESPIGLSLAYLVSSLNGVGPFAATYLEKLLDSTDMQTRLKFYEAREALLINPAEKMEVFLALLKDHGARDPRELRTAQNHALWLLEPQAESSPEVRAKAHYLNALVLRHEGKFDEFRKAIQSALEATEAVKNVDVKKGKELAGEFARTRDEMTNPMVYFVPQADRLQKQGQLAAALNVLTLGLEAMPGDPTLLARRSTVRYELLRGKIVSGGEDAKVQKAIQDIRDDVGKVAATNANAKIEATFVLGMLEEDLGNLKDAEDLYRAALSLHKGPAEAVGRIRLALGRVLQRERSPAGKALPQSRLEDETDKTPREQRTEFVADDDSLGDGGPDDPVRPGTSDRSVRPAGEKPADAEPAANYHPLTALVAAAVIAQPPQFSDEEDPAETKRLNESIEIAKELMQSDNPTIQGQGKLLMGLALARRGRPTEGLRFYVDGLKQVFPGKETKDLIKLMEENPIFQQPDATTRPDKGLADFHYARGRQLYFDKKYAEAEVHLKQAVTYYDSYAPYLYYLGLSQLAQNTRLKRAAADFALTKAGKLEVRYNAYQEVNVSLERVQGELRQQLNRYRLGGVNTAN